MIADKEQIEQPGIRAIDHPCEAMVPVEDDEEKPTLIRCRILALKQCLDCAAWICGTEGLDHSIVCVRCGETFCQEHWPAHKASKDCELRITDEDIREFV